MGTSSKHPDLIETEFPSEETSTTSADKVVQKDVKRRWQSYLWDTFDKSPQERRFLAKLDAALLTFASLGMFPPLLYN